MKNIIILGSGRSGTSMLAGSLAKSGYNLGANANYLGKNKANPKGFFEDYEVNTINEDIIKRSLPFTFNEKIRKTFFKTFTFYRARWLANIPLFYPIKSTVAINERIKNVIKNEPFCFKDPRFSYTLCIWDKFLNRNTRFIVIFREPDKTAISIVRECKENAALNSLKIDEKKAMNIWIAMYRYILKVYEKDNNKERWMFVHYNQIFDEQKILEIETFIEAKIDLSFPDSNISRTNIYNFKINVSCNQVYNQLIKLAN